MLRAGDDIYVCFVFGLRGTGYEVDVLSNYHNEETDLRYVDIVCQRLGVTFRIKLEVKYQLQARETGPRTWPNNNPGLVSSLT